MDLLIVKLGAAGDVVRTTPLLRCFDGRVTWVTAAGSIALLEGLTDKIRPVSWDDRERSLDVEYDLVINLEDSVEVARFAKSVTCRKLAGAYLDGCQRLSYTTNFKAWFDLSLISVHGKDKADALKLQNRRTYQEMIFESLNLEFTGERYLLPTPVDSGLKGDVAIAADSGPVWPMKKWAYYGELKCRLEAEGLTVNVLPKRSSLLEHLGDICNHRCLVGGDSLPMHLALGSGIPCVTLFTCTSPWEIHDYGIQTKIVSPLLEEFFYKRGYNERATTAISVDEVEAAVMTQLELVRSKA